MLADLKLSSLENAKLAERSKNLPWTLKHVSRKPQSYLFVWGYPQNYNQLRMDSIFLM